MTTCASPTRVSVELSRNQGATTGPYRALRAASRRADPRAAYCVPPAPITLAAAICDAPVNTSSDMAQALATDRPDDRASTPNTMPTRPTANARASPSRRARSGGFRTSEADSSGIGVDTLCELPDHPPRRFRRHRDPHPEPSRAAQRLQRRDDAGDDRRLRSHRWRRRRSCCDRDRRRSGVLLRGRPPRGATPSITRSSPAPTPGSPPPRRRAPRGSPR